MSDLIDFAAILGDRLAHSIQGEPITDVYTPTGVGTYLLAAKVSELCPDCVSGLRVPDLTTCHHPNAPTIGRMLAEWQSLTAALAVFTEAEFRAALALTAEGDAR